MVDLNNDLEYYKEGLSNVRKTILKLESEGVQEYTDDQLRVQRIQLKELAEREAYYEGKISQFSGSASPSTAKKRGNMRQFVPIR